MSHATDTVRVLHVDDEPRFAEMAAEFVEREDDRITVETATSVEEGLEHLDDDTDCVVSDYDMAETNGIAFLESIREEYPDLPFILFTGKGSEAVASDAISAGVTDYLQKGAGTEQYELLCKRIENAVEKRRAQVNYRELFEKTPVGLTMHDPTTGEIIDANRAFGDLLGYDPTELEGNHPGELSPEGSPFDRETATRLIQEAVETGSRRFEWLDETKAGDVVRVDVTLEPTRIDGQRRVLAVVQATTDETDRETVPRRERERFQALFEALPEPVTHVRFENEDPVVQDVNRAFEETFGYDRETVVGHSINETVVPDDRTTEAETIDRRIRTGETVRREIRRRTDDGIRDFLFTTAPVGESDPVDECFGIAFDITERKEYERELERQNERMEEFARIVSHDLRNPLSIAEGNLELLQSDCDSERLDTIAQAHDRMRALIEDILTIAREGESVTNPDPVDLGSVVDRCWQNVDTADATLRADTDQVVAADPGRCQQLIENLFRNAIEHGGDDVTLTVGDCEGGFYVADDGPGIPGDDRDRVFETGYSTTSQGAGLGLSIVKRVVDAHDWDVAVTDSEAGGTRFEFTGVDTVE